MRREARRQVRGARGGLRAATHSHRHRHLTSRGSGHAPTALSRRERGARRRVSIADAARRRSDDAGRAFFGTPVRLLEGVSVDDAIASGVHTRVNGSTGKRQLLTSDVLALLRRELPADAFSLSAFTREDLYPEDTWNFVFGQASLRERVGVFSFARYDPAFFGEPLGAGADRLRLRRALNVMAHETGHMFGLAHCVWFSCVMNGSNHLEETDRRPFHPCPVCLHKLAWSVRFDVVQRYAMLERLFRGAGFADEADWTRARLDEL